MTSEATKSEVKEWIRHLQKGSTVAVRQYHDKHVSHKRELGKVVNVHKTNGTVQVMCSKITMTSEPVMFNCFGEEIVPTSEINNPCRLYMEEPTKAETEVLNRKILTGQILRFDYSKVPTEVLETINQTLKMFQ